MELRLSEHEKNVIYIYHGNEAVRCPMSRFFQKLSLVANNYIPLNEYWALQPPQFTDRLFSHYQEAAAIIDEGLDYETTIEELTAVTGKIIDLVDYSNLTEWVLTYGGITYNKDMLTDYTGRYERRLTYVKEEYDQLIVFSMLMKMLNPIWGLFASISPNTTDGFNEMSVLRMLEKCDIYRIPAMVRLADYCDAMVEKAKKDKTSNSLTSAVLGKHIGISEMPRLYLALVIVQRVSVGEFRNKNDTLIKIIYKYLDYTKNKYSKGVRDKNGFSADSDEEESVAEKYRISQRVPDNEIATGEAYVENIARFVKDVNPDGNVKKAKAYATLIEKNPYHAIANFHTQFIGLVCDRAISARTCRLMNRRPFIVAIGVTAGWLSDNGYQSLANLLLSPHFERDNESLEIHSVSGFAFSPLTKENKEAVESMYSHQQMDLQGKSKGNPGINMIEQIIGEINSYNWDENMVMPQNLRNEVVELLKLREADYVSKYGRTN